MPRTALVDLAQHWLCPKLKAGDAVIDATVGNGFDTLFLAKCVAPGGQVFGFDIQAQALENAKAKIPGDLVASLYWRQNCHSAMSEHLPVSLHGRIKAVMFNLGYLPGADKTIITRPCSTLSALKQAVELISLNGAITVVAYPGHAGGGNECATVAEFCRNLNPLQFRLAIIDSISATPTAPKLFQIEKIA
ncbi:MAG: SAM-dependent methyltransferase [Methylobacter sp.]|nr:MAG: SAM-dependent methyltransferase [Methylobacter sp.]